MFAINRLRIRAFLGWLKRERTVVLLASFVAGVYFGYLLLMLLELGRVW